MDSEEALRHFHAEEKRFVEEQGKDLELAELTHSWISRTLLHRYTYHFSVLGRPIIQFPQDILAFQEIVWQVKPDLIIETGIAHGGSLILSASMLALLDYCEAANSRRVLNLNGTRRKVIGIDIDIRPHNRAAIEKHPLSHLIMLIQGSSVAQEVISQVQNVAKGYSSIVVCLDSNHTHEHVLAELRAYAPLTTNGSYCLVSDTIIENLPKGSFMDRPWGSGNNPRTAVNTFLESDDRFIADLEMDSRLLITNSPGGYLRRVRD